MGILVAVTDDDRFEAVLTVARRLATGLEQELYVTHITEDQRASEEEREFRDDVRAFLSDAEVPVEVTLEHLGQSGFRPGTTIGNQLLEATEDVSVDHVVLGHRSKDRLTAVREGHTSFVVAEQATVPVTVVPEAIEPR